MSGWLSFLIIYVIFLALGFGLALLYRRYTAEHEKKQFNKFMKLRAFLYAQVDTLAKAYEELLVKCEAYFTALEENQEEQTEPDLKETITLIKDVETNLVILKTELSDLAVSKGLESAKKHLLMIINQLGKHIFKLLGAKDMEELLKVIEAREFDQNANDFKIVNSTIKKFMKQRNIDEKDYFYQGKQLYV